MTDRITQLIKEIPGEDGFLKESAEEDFLEVGERLLEAGIIEDSVVSVLNKLYWAVAGCYGD